MSKILYPYEDRVKARLGTRRLETLSTQVQEALEAGTTIPPENIDTIKAIARTSDPHAWPNALNTIAEQIRNQHLERLYPLAFNDFNAYCEIIDPSEPPESPWHIWLTDMLEQIERDPAMNRIVLNVPPGHAKDLILSTPIFTPTGWTTMGELKVGDTLYDDTGAVCHVTWKSPVYKNQEVYRVTTDCGDEIVCGAGHEWPIVLCRKPRKPAFIRGAYKCRGKLPYKIKTTKDLSKKRSKRPMIIRAGVTHAPHADLPLDPYILGVWLGDGCKGSGVIASSSEDADGWMRPEFARLGWPCAEFRQENYTFAVPGLSKVLTGMKLRNDKHIPIEYFLASPDQRVSLLQGLIDSDGTVAPDGQVMFCNKNRDLIEGVQFLVRSLGCKATICESRSVLYGVDHGPYWRVSFYKTDAARMPRKRALCRDAVRTPNTYITVTPAGHADTQCIEVSSPNHLFLVGKSLTPTHNPIAITTPILMADGSYRQLGDIKTGDMIRAGDGLPHAVTAVHEQGILKVVKVITKDGRTILAAEDHPFLRADTKRETFTNAAQLRPPHKLAAIIPPDVADTSKQSEDVFRLAAYVNALGSYARTLTKTGIENQSTIRFFTTKHDEAFALRDLATRLGVSIKPYPIRRTNGIGLNGSRPVVDYLCTFMNPKQSAKERTVPDFVFRGSKAKIAAYISVALNTHVDCFAYVKVPHLRMYSVGTPWLLDLQALLLRLGVRTIVELPCQFGGRACLHFDEAATTALASSGVVLAPVIAAKLAAKGPAEPGSPLGTLKNADGSLRPIFGDEVESVEPDGKAACRCLTIEGEPTFVAGGVVVHNSTYASRRFVAWRLGRDSSQRIIGGGHSQKFVEEEFSAKIREEVDSEQYRRIFKDVRISATTRNKNQWNIAGTRGRYVARGVGQGIHGFRATFIVVDDPYPTTEAADSPAYRNKVVLWFKNDIGTRLLPKGKMFVIMTRFHEDDLTGEIEVLNKSFPDNAKYKIISVPGICTDPRTDVLKRRFGEVLWDYYSHEYFNEKKIELGFHKFMILVQQSPNVASPDNLASKIKTYKVAPHLSKEAHDKAIEAGQVDENKRVIVNPRDYYRRITTTCDTAAKEKQRSDYSVAQVWGETYDGLHYLLFQERKKVDFNKLITMIESAAKKFGGSDSILVEDKGQGTAYLQARGATDTHVRLAPAPLVAINPGTQSKSFRLDEVSPMIEAGEVVVPELATYSEAFMQELAKFVDGTATHDDQVDAMTQYLKHAGKKRKRWGTRKVTSRG